MSFEWDHRGRYILLLILLLGGFLRLYHLGAPYISEDEAYHAVVASRWAETGSALPPSGKAYTRGMPLIALDALTLRYLPFEMETSVRLPAALLGILNIWLFFLLGRRYGGVPIGLMAATIFAVSPWCISIGTMARMYEFLMTSTLLVFLSYERLLESPRGRNAALLAAGLCLSITAHDLGILLILLPVAGILVHFRQRRLAILLGMVAAGQLAFRKAYPVILEFLIPSRVKFPDGPPREMFIVPRFGFQQLEGQTVLWAWLAAIVLLVVGALLVLKGRPQRELLYLLPAATLILAFGAAGFLVVGGLVLAAFFALSGLWEEPKIARAHRLYMTGLYAATIFIWSLLAVVIAIQRGPIGLPAVAAAFEPTIHYPEIGFEAIRPLLMDPRTIILFHAGMAGLALVLAWILWNGPLLPGRSSLTARILFLLGALFVVGAVESTYSTHKYIYFLFPAALLSFLEIMKAYWQASARPTRVALALVGLVFVALSELPRAVAQMPDRDGHRPLPSHVKWLPDYFRSEQAMKHLREWRQLDYRAAGKILSTRVQQGDVLLADAVHQLQVYLPATVIQGHLTTPHDEFRFGERHYFTGSVMLRTPEDLSQFLESRSSGASTRAWIVLAGYDSVWQDILPSRLSEYTIWADGEIEIYSMTVDELLTIMRSAEAVSTSGSQQSRD
jgi:Dolichyl-phosphate-mannose-protein mannosyltransferase